MDLNWKLLLTENTVELWEGSEPELQAEVVVHPRPLVAVAVAADSDRCHANCQAKKPKKLWGVKVGGIVQSIHTSLAAACVAFAAKLEESWKEGRERERADIFIGVGEG